MNDEREPGQQLSDVPPWVSNAKPPKSGASKWLWGVIVILAIAVVVLAVTLLTRPGGGAPAADPPPSSAPSSEPIASATPEVDESEEATEAAVEETPGVDTEGSVGEPVENAGTKLTVDAVSTQNSIPMDDSELASPPEGGEFFVVEATVENTGQTSQDLTCSWPIEIYAVDGQGRQFDPVESLYSYEGNPECNDQLQPGFSTQMTWPFAIPEDAEIDHILFRDTDSDDYDDLSAVSVDSP